MSISTVPNIQPLSLLLDQNVVSKYSILSSGEKLKLLNNNDVPFEIIQNLWYSLEIENRQALLKEIGKNAWTELSFREKAYSYWQCGFFLKDDSQYYIEIGAKAMIINEKILLPFLKKTLQLEQTREEYERAESEKRRIDQKTKELNEYFTEFQQRQTRIEQLEDIFSSYILETLSLLSFTENFLSYLEKDLISKDTTLNELKYYQQKCIDFFSNKRFSASAIKETLNKSIMPFFHEMIEKKKKWADLCKMNANEFFKNITDPNSLEVQKIFKSFITPIDRFESKGSFLLMGSDNTIDKEKIIPILGNGISKKKVHPELRSMMTMESVDFSKGGGWCKGSVAWFIWLYFHAKKVNVEKRTFEEEGILMAIASQFLKAPLQAALLQTFFNGELQGSDTPESFLVSEKVKKDDFVLLLKNLKDGVYFSAVTTDDRNNEGHAIAFIKQKGVIYYFNNNEGLFKFETDEREETLYHKLAEISNFIKRMYNNKDIFFHFTLCKDLFSREFFTRQSKETPWKEIHEGISLKEASW